MKTIAEKINVLELVYDKNGVARTVYDRITYYVDENYNIWSCGLFTYDQVVTICIPSLDRCTYCRNCIDCIKSVRLNGCVKCKVCRNCVGCIRSTNCSFSENCSDCVRARGSKRCKFCIGLLNCEYLESSKNCIDSKECTWCQDIFHCEGSTRCIRCENCTDCEGLTDVVNEYDEVNEGPNNDSSVGLVCTVTSSNEIDYDAIGSIGGGRFELLSSTDDPETELDKTYIANAMEELNMKHAKTLTELAEETVSAIENGELNEPTELAMPKRPVKADLPSLGHAIIHEVKLRMVHRIFYKEALRQYKEQLRALKLQQK